MWISRHMRGQIVGEGLARRGLGPSRACAMLTEAGASSGSYSTQWAARHDSSRYCSSLGGAFPVPSLLGKLRWA